MTSSLNEYLLNTLGEMPGILGVAPTRDMMADIRQCLVAEAAADRSAAEMKRLEQDVDRILTAVEQKILTDKKAKEYTGGLFGVSGKD